MEAVTELCPEKINMFKMVSLAPNTIGRRVEHIGNTIFKQTINKAQSFNWYSLALDESTDISDTAQLLVCFRGVDNNLNVTQELASLYSMHSTKTGEDIFKEIEKTLNDYKLDWSRLQCVTIDGARNMAGIKKVWLDKSQKRVK